MNLDESAIIEYELEKLRNKSLPEAVRIGKPSKSRWTWILLFFAGMILFKLSGDLLKLIFQ